MRTIKLLIVHVITMVFLLPFITHAQGTLTGTVTSSGKPLDNISVIASKGGGALTDKNGKYSLKLSAGSHSITFSSIGYLPQTISVTITEGQQQVLDVSLQESTEQLQDILVVGTRSLPRSVVTSPLPVDNFDASVLKSTGQTTFDKSLQYRVPSFNTVNTPVNDATTLLDPYEIRNLGPSRTLILVNGKRKNLSSLLYVQFSPGRGETGADISAIPLDAIKNVEILRDGASAQYGSDAIAGVMNIILKDRYQYSSLTFTGGGTHKGDGANYGLSLNSGGNFGNKGFINYTIALSQQDNAVRSGKIDLVTEQATFGGDDYTNSQIQKYLAVYPDGNNENGTGATSAAKFLYNLGIPVGDNGMFYSNAAYVFKYVKSNANFRVPYWRIDQGLLHTRIPGAPDYTASGYGGTGVQELFEVDQAAGLYQGYIGYEPTFEGDLSDFNATVGFRKEINGWKQDISFTAGGNQQLYSVNNTVNRTLLKASPTAFKPGGYGFYNFIGNVDISKSITDNFAIAFGTEARKEVYKIIAGDTASYSGEGANSFPGIRQENSGTFTRYNIGGYFDASLNITKDWLVNGTVRGEKYSDFGSAFVYKISSRVKAGDKFVLRGSASSGFRAPTLHQIYNTSTQASFVAGTIQLSGLFNNNSKQAFLLGVPNLKPEKSTNFTLGIGLTPSKNVSITLDYYGITIKDRIVYSSAISSSDPSTTLYQILQAAGVVQAQFFINGIKTNTQGLDFVGNYRNIRLGGSGKLAINVAANYTFQNEIKGSPKDPDAVKAAGATILSTQIRSLLQKSRPLYKGIVGFDLNVKKWNFNLNNTLFGPTEFQDLDNGGGDMENIKQKFSPNVVTDLNIGYDFSSKISGSIAVSNIFNVLPKWKLEALNSAGQAVLDDPAAKSLLEGFLEFSGRYRILAYNGSQFSQLGTLFQATLTFKF